jgi:hypothetical protein
MKHTNNTKDWDNHYSLGAKTVGAIASYDENTFYVSGTQSSIYAYVYRFNNNGNMVVDEWFHSFFGPDRGLIVSSLKFYGDYGYLITIPATTFCQGLSCDPVFYNVTKFNALNFDSEWNHMYSSDGSNIYKTDCVVLSDDLFVGTLIANEFYDPPVQCYRSNIVALSKEDGEYRGCCLGELKDYIGDISLDFYEDIVEIDGINIIRHKIAMAAGEIPDSVLYDFWVPKKIFGKMPVEEGWNLVSIPVLPDTKYTPTHFSNISQFLGLNEDGSYRAIPGDEELLPGRGYWALAEYDLNYIILGMEILKSYFSPTDKWTLKGFGSYPGYVKTLSGNDPICLMKYANGGYIPLPEGGPTEPGLGYWVPPVPQLFYFKTNEE